MFVVSQLTHANERGNPRQVEQGDSRKEEEEEEEEEEAFLLRGRPTSLETWRY